MKRIAITGTGSINALGVGVDVFAQALRAGRCGIGPLSVFPTTGHRSGTAAEVRDLRPPAWAPRSARRRASRTALLALHAAGEAWATAGIGEADRAAAGLVVGTTTGGMPVGELCFRDMLDRGAKGGRLAGWMEAPVSAPTEVLAAVFGCRGPRSTVSTACSSGANALGFAADWIRAGRASVVLCGGTDALCRSTFAGFDALQALDRDRCRPFDRHRSGLTLGEGAAMFVLEDWEHAVRRGARILGEFVSYGISADAHHLTQPHPEGAGAAAAMRRALSAGRLAPEAVDYVNAHGTGTPLNDVIETRAIKSVFGAHAQRMPVTSTKSMVGHCLGAAGAIEALASLIALREGFVPPTVSLADPDPECDLDYVPHTSRRATLGVALSNSYGFGGNNTSLILRKSLPL
jgi:3-oxoacyl-[acyl-carrier-protein] synthase II